MNYYLNYYGYGETHEFELKPEYVGKEAEWVPEIYDEFIRICAQFDPPLPLHDFVAKLLASGEPLDVPEEGGSSSYHPWQRELLRIRDHVRKNCSEERQKEINEKIKINLEKYLKELCEAEWRQGLARLATAFVRPSELQDQDFSAFIYSLLPLLCAESAVYSPFEVREYGPFANHEETEHSYINIVVVSDAFKGDHARDRIQQIKSLINNPDSFVRPIAMTYEEFRADQSLGPTRLLCSNQNCRCWTLPSPAS